MSEDPQFKQTVMLANQVGQIGCVTAIVAIIIIAIAFGIGSFLDSFFDNERRILTVLFLLGSFPVTLYAMVRISLGIVARAQQRAAGARSENRPGEKENKKTTT